MGLRFFRSKRFEPTFPIIPLHAGEAEARQLLASHALVTEEDPGSNSAIAQYLLVADDGESRLTAGIWNGRVRFANYLTSQFNDSDNQKGKKLRWFIEHYGGPDQFDEPHDTGYMIFWRNPSKKILIVFGLHMGPVRVIDEDASHWLDAQGSDA